MIFNIDRFQFFAMHCMKTIFCWKGNVTMLPRLFRPRIHFFPGSYVSWTMRSPYYPSLTRGGGLRRISLIIFIYVVRVLLLWCQ